MTKATHDNLEVILHDPVSKKDFDEPSEDMIDPAASLNPVLTEEQKEEASIAITKDTVLQLKDIATSFTELKYTHPDHYGFLLIVFLKRQLVHLKSFLLLEDSRDSILIVRSVIEADLILRWIASGIDKDARIMRALDYQHLLMLESQKDIREHTSKKGSVTKEAMKTLLQHLYTLSDLLPLKDNDEKLLRRRFESKQFLNGLSGFDKIYDIHSSSEDEEMSHIIYSHFRAYVCWNPMRIAMYADGEVVNLKERSLSEITHGYFALFLSLSFVMKEIAVNFNLPQEGMKIKELSINCQIELLKIFFWGG